MNCVAEMVSNKTRKAKLILSMVVLSMVTPLGVLIGLVLTLHGQTETGAHVMLVGVLQGVAGGTLLYITFFEVRRWSLCHQSRLFL
jgi:zinc transporter 1/2/3